MNRFNSNPNFDPYAHIDDNSDVWNSDADVARNANREKQAEQLRAGAKLNLAHRALQESASKAPVHSDPDAPKRDRARLRAPE